MTLKLRAERKDGALPRLFLSGSIDEHSPIEEVLGSIRVDAVLDLSLIERINSMGLMIWLKWIGILTANHRISIEIISYPLAIYAAQLVDLFGSAKARSCLAPYYCPSCKTNRELPVSAEEVRLTKGEPPPKKCPQCGTAMDFDELDQYFSFLNEPA